MRPCATDPVAAVSKVCNDLDALAEPFRLKAERLMGIIDRDGLPFRTFETRRAFSRSAELFMKGREYRDGVAVVVDKSKVVSNARAGSSPHNWGLAIDCVLITDIDHAWWEDEAPTGAWDTGYDRGKLVRPSVKLAWERYGRAVRQAELSWGGDWVGGMVDLPHAELRTWKTLRPANWQAIAQREVQSGR